MTDPISSDPPRTRTAGSLHRHGGLLSLDFVNTATWNGETVLREHWHDFEDVLQWGATCQVADVDAVRDRISARHGSSVRPADDLEAARRLRRCLRNLLTRPSGQHAGGSWARDADHLQAVLRTTIAHSSLRGPALPLEWRAAPDARSWLFGPVALCAASVLTSPDSLRVRPCEGEGCGWLFLDRSRSHRRRWCAMEPCGNRIKARAHAERRRRQGAGDRGPQP